MVAVANRSKRSPARRSKRVSGRSGSGRSGGRSRRAERKRAGPIGLVGGAVVTLLDVVVGGASTVFTLLKLLVLAAIIVALVVALQGCASAGGAVDLPSEHLSEFWSYPTEHGPAVLLRSNGEWLVPVSLADAAEELAGYDVVFAGEHHGTGASHALQFALLRELHRLRRTKVTLSMEQFERDTQRELSGYLVGELTQEEFLAKSRPWPNYRDYQPMVEFAKGYGLPVLAANIPRRYASQVFRQGVDSLEQLSHEERTWVASRVILEPGDYMDKFYQFAGGENLSFYAAQAIKDDTMAESIVFHADGFPDRLILHTNGVFHSDGHLGTVERVAARRPLLRMAVTTTVRSLLVVSGEALPELAGGEWQELEGIGHYWVPDGTAELAEFVLLTPFPPPRPVAVPPGHGRGNAPVESGDE